MIAWLAWWPMVVFGPTFSFGEYGVVRVQYYRICLGVLVLYSAWILYLLVLTRITKIDFCITSLDLLLVQFSQIGLWFCFTETICKKELWYETTASSSRLAADPHKVPLYWWLLPPPQTHPVLQVVFAFVFFAWLVWTCCWFILLFS